MHFGPQTRSAKHWSTRSYGALRVKATIALLTLNAAAPLNGYILPAPQKLTESFAFSCQMMSEQTPVSHLSVSINYEPMTGKNDLYRVAYWWTLTGDSERYPSNRTYMNMRSLETDQATSGLSFEAADGWIYYYNLYYTVEERFPSFFYVPDHLVVRRTRADDKARTVQLVGMGECNLTQTKPIQ